MTTASKHEYHGEAGGSMNLRPAGDGKGVETLLAAR
jgi:hypothetical protein